MSQSYKLSFFMENEERATDWTVDVSQSVGQSLLPCRLQLDDAQEPSFPQPQ